MDDTTMNLGVAREPERRKITGVSRTQWWRNEGQGLVPMRVRLGPNSVGWFRHELYGWLAEQAAKRDSGEDAVAPSNGDAGDVATSDDDEEPRYLGPMSLNKYRKIEKD